VATTSADPVQRLFPEHARQHRPLLAYGGLTVAFNGLLAAFLVLARRRLPERYGAADLALGAVASAKAGRLIARDRVTAVVRAPFTRFQEDAAHGEVEEAARGTGARRAIGELLVCPYCLSQWLAAAFVAGLALAPRPTRAVAAIFAVFQGSDFVQLARGRAGE
jgi:hypothetical protein